MVTAKSGCVIMNVKGENVLYYQKCNHCQHSESDLPLRETPLKDNEIATIGDYQCPECGGTTSIQLRFHT